MVPCSIGRGPHGKPQSDAGTLLQRLKEQLAAGREHCGKAVKRTSLAGALDHRLPMNDFWPGHHRGAWTGRLEKPGHDDKPACARTV